MEDHSSVSRDELWAQDVDKWDEFPGHFTEEKKTNLTRT